ncbi:hypothetical protein BSKO_01070 [Bryopsis sp. KO-2023]|nr:hypothetical protein BSKO_01070 [Bryopsis sp. KO-2023]
MLPFTRKCFVSVWGVLVCACLVSGLEFNMIFQTKCVMEDIPAETLVVGEYSAFDKTNRVTPIAVSVQVEDPKGKLLHDKRDSSGQFTFTTKVAGEYKACFTAPDSKTSQNTKLKVDWRLGMGATDWDEVAKQEHLDGLQTAMKKLEQTVKDVQEQMVLLRKREEEMRDLNEATNSRVAFFGVASVGVCVSLAGWQLWYLKRFFTRKKLI